MLVVLGLAARSDEVFSWDARLHEWLYGYHESDEFNALADDAIGFLVSIGADVILVSTLVGALAVLASRRRIRKAFFLVASFGAAVVLTFVLKEVFERDPLSEYGKYEVPSGHAARSLAVVGALVVLMWGTRWRGTTVAAGGVFVAALGVSLVYEDWHLPSDVVGGWALAIAVLTATWATLGARGTVR